MHDSRIFSKKLILLIVAISTLLLSLSLYLQYNYQIKKQTKKFSSHIQREVKKSINKKIFEIEASIKSLSSFYQASEEFSISTFTYVSQDLIKYYPIIENIIYANIVYEDEVADFYKDMYNNGLFNYKIKTDKEKEYYLAIANIAPDSYEYGKYYGLDILKNDSLKDFFKDLSISSKIAYSHENILNENKKLLYLAKATYFGTDIPNINERIEHSSGYFIFSINLQEMLYSLKNEFSSYNFSLDNFEESNINKSAIYTNKIKLHLPTSDKEIIYISNNIYFKDLPLIKILINSSLLLLFIAVLVYILYIYKKHLLYKEFSQTQLHKSEKMASLGQMIGNISHQWRQPLSAISMIASSIIIDKELGMLDENKLDQNMKDIVDKTQYLSETINTFRDFIKEEKDIKEIYLEDRVQKSMSIVALVLNDNGIEIQDNINYEERTKLKMVMGELDQVLINIVNNAKDALIEKQIEKPKIKLDIQKTNTKVILTIEDNAGGIPDNIISKIFEPYFTTKHQAQGTGLGLHMSYRIINESLKGKLYVKNTSIGAKFYIELPLNN